jgi:hypothetical protein
MCTIRNLIKSNRSSWTNFHFSYSTLPFYRLFISVTFPAVALRFMFPKILLLRFYDWLSDQVPKKKVRLSFCPFWLILIRSPILIFYSKLTPHCDLLFWINFYVYLALLRSVLLAIRKPGAYWFSINIWCHPLMFSKVVGLVTS